MNDSNSTFTFPKRQYLHRQLDEMLRLWHRRSGQGTFSFTVNNRDPNLQFGIQLDFRDVSTLLHTVYNIVVSGNILATLSDHLNKQLYPNYM